MAFAGDAVSRATHELRTRRMRRRSSGGCRAPHLEHSR
ncbi:hypothetical protein C7S13_8213 [Burkholderia cepacia]|nr:hypothetical protein [Burkholderia cepacia]